MPWRSCPDRPSEELNGRSLTRDRPEAIDEHLELFELHVRQLWLLRLFERGVGPGVDAQASDTGMTEVHELPDRVLGDVLIDDPGGFARKLGDILLDGLVIHSSAEIASE